MSYKKRPKNKQELPSKSGKKRKKVLPRKTVVEFEFLYNDNTYKNGKGARLKIMDDGGVSCLIKNEDDKWILVKAQLTKIRMKIVVIKKENPKKR